MSLHTRRLEHGRFIRPAPKDGAVAIPAARMGLSSRRDRRARSAPHREAGRGWPIAAGAWDLPPTSGTVVPSSRHGRRALRACDRACRARDRTGRGGGDGGRGGAGEGCGLGRRGGDRDAEARGREARTRAPRAARPCAARGCSTRWSCNRRSSRPRRARTTSPPSGSRRARGPSPPRRGAVPRASRPPRTRPARAGGDRGPLRLRRLRLGARIVKLGEDVTGTLEVVPRRWKAIRTVRERCACARRGNRPLDGCLTPPRLRADRPAARTLPSHAARPGGTEPAGQHPVREVRPASAAEPPGGALRPRGRRAQPLRPLRTRSAPRPRRRRRCAR